MLIREENEWTHQVCWSLNLHSIHLWWRLITVTSVKHGNNVSSELRSSYKEQLGGTSEEQPGILQRQMEEERALSTTSPVQFTQAAAPAACTAQPRMQPGSLQQALPFIGSACTTLCHLCLSSSTLWKGWQADIDTESTCDSQYSRSYNTVIMWNLW